MHRGSWDEILTRGMGQFVWRYGVVCFGGLFFLANMPVRWFSINPDLRHDGGSLVALVVISFVYSMSAGGAFGIVMWHVASLIRQISKRSVPARPVSVGIRVRSAAAANK